jgi:hypothetical protein
MSKRILLAALLAAGCIDTDAAVFVDATLGAPALTLVPAGGFGVTLQGSFALELHLGARASGTSQVTYTSFSLKAADGSVVVESLPVAVDKPSPVAVDPGSDVLVTFTIDSGATVLDNTVKDRICAGQVKIVGVIEDSLESESSPLESAPFSPSGC